MEIDKIKCEIGTMDHQSGIGWNWIIRVTLGTKRAWNRVSERWERRRGEVGYV